MLRHSNHEAHHAARSKPIAVPTPFEEDRPGDTVIIQALECKGSTFFLTWTLGAVTELHPDVPAFIYRPQWRRVFADDAWNLGRDIPSGDDVQAFLPGRRDLQGLEQGASGFLCRVIST